MKNRTSLGNAAIAGFAIAATTALMPQASLADAHTDALEQRLRIMEQQMRMLQDELASVKAKASGPAEERVMELEEWRAKVEESPAYNRGESQVFFRGGYTHLNVGRKDQVFTDLYENQVIDSVLGTEAGSNGARDGFYAGAGIEHSVTRDFWGFWDKAEVFGEITFQWARFRSNEDAQRVVPTAATALGVNPKEDLSTIVGGKTTTGVTMTMFTLTAAPKIKFFPGSKIRPWIIPVGWAFHVISPPSDAGTVLNAGAMFGGGVEYNYWKNMNFGIDARYQLTGDNLDGVDTDHWTIGGYAGLIF